MLRWRGRPPPSGAAGEDDTATAVGSPPPHACLGDRLLFPELAPAGAPAAALAPAAASVSAPPPPSSSPSPAAAGAPSSSSGPAAAAAPSTSSAAAPAGTRSLLPTPLSGPPSGGGGGQVGHEQPSREQSFSTRGLITSVRPWTLGMSVPPQLLTIAVAARIVGAEAPSGLHFAFVLLSILTAHGAANLVNSYCDYLKGIDTKCMAGGDRCIVDGLVSLRVVRALAVVALSLFASFGLWSFFYDGRDFVLLGLAAFGALSAVLYTAGPLPLKYWALGDFLVFLCFGPAVVAFSSEALFGCIHLAPILFILPFALAVVATLHANNFRDIESDRRMGVVTVANLLGPANSRLYYCGLLAAAHVALLLLGWAYGCAGVLASFVVVPRSVWLCNRIGRAENLKDQDEETAKTSMLLGLVMAFGIFVVPGRLSPVRMLALSG